jgi:hypothetical protein
MKTGVGEYLTATVPYAYEAFLSTILARIAGMDLPTYEYPKTISAKYVQTGIRFTTTIGSADVGAQYYYGLLPRPTVTLSGVENFWETFNPSITSNSITPVIKYNRFHQIGVDYAQILAGFNVRAEVAVNLTEDMSGDKGDVYNPFVSWSLGFDHGLPLGITMNLQGAGDIRLFHNKIRNNPALDTEAGITLSTSRVTFSFSKKFFKDELEVKLAGVWCPEYYDVLIMPGVVWNKGDITVNVSGGIFTGDERGDFGQYHKNSFIKAGLTYSF